MSSILDAWDTGRPIYDRLPNRNGLYENEVTDWLTAFWDLKAIALKQKIDDIAIKQINPLTCDVEWLDYLSILYGWNSKHWQKSWTGESKRLLLARSYDFIWERKGNKVVLEYVLNSLKLKNRVLEIGDFIIGTNLVGDPIGSNPWQIKIILPIEYERGDQLVLVKYIVERFVPCWIFVKYEYSDLPFVVSELLEIDETTVLGNELNRAIEI
jgi:hypothetical protein